MGIFYDTQQLPSFRNAVLTAGTFDGVHEGHKVILRKVVEHARKVNGESVLLTFEPHPRKLLFPDRPLGVITPLEEKLQLISDTGIEHIVVVPFNKEFASLSAEDYVSRFLVDLFHPHSIVIGYDHRFGKGRKGDLHLLEECAPLFDYELLEIPAQLIDEAAVSSTKIRNSLLNGNAAEAMQMLGRPFSLKGMVVRGNQLGRTIGYPTANLQPGDADQIVPGVGIYAVRATYDGHLFSGMMSIGYNPTVTDKKELRLEVNIFDFDKDVYGEQLEIFFIARLRDEVKFSSLEALKEQLHKDKEDSLNILSPSN